MRTAIYGCGDRLEKWIINNAYFKKWLIEECDYDIQVIIDRDRKKQGQFVCINTDVSVVELNKCVDFDIECFIITPSVGSEMIRNSIKQCIDNDPQIIELDTLIKMYYKWLYCQEKVTGANAVEIGGPSKIFEDLYAGFRSCDGVNYSVETTWGDFSSFSYEYSGRQLGKQYICEATELKDIPDTTYDVYLSSNNLEHIANPIRALTEAYRVVKNGGLILIAVPRKENTFDHLRDVTSFSHLLDDYLNKVDEYDLSHLSEILDNHDFLLDPECGGREKFLDRSQKNYINRCLHHHVFSMDTLKTVFEYLGFKILRTGADPYNWIIVGEKIAEMKK